jgi:hypothetical protein
MGVPPIVWRPQASGAKALDALGRSTDALAKRSAAQAVVASFAELFQDPDLREEVIENASCETASLK